MELISVSLLPAQNKVKVRFFRGNVVVAMAWASLRNFEQLSQLDAVVQRYLYYGARFEHYDDRRTLDIALEPARTAAMAALRIPA
jgi:hypothetical protein